MSGTLYIVPTPIGNLEDITLRAIRILRSVDLVAAEDTRRTKHLLSHYGISTYASSFHAHNLRTRLPQLLKRLQDGASIAVVSDAGTPGISDPGTEIIQACITTKIPIEVLPGPSAPLTALVLSGFPNEGTTFFGFPPSRGNDRKKWFIFLSQLHKTIITFEAPHRIKNFLKQLSDFLGDRPIVVCRELTKLHQEVLRGSAQDILKQLKTIKGEFTIVIGPLDTNLKSKNILITVDKILIEIGRLTKKDGLGRREAIRNLAKKYNIRSNELYKLIEESKK
jgi:16S rRNA (cytidine1402-2'-O)-methyltransferase